MKIKYYLRGLGIGIILTTIILSIGSKKEALSDTEIISQARELGMVMKEETEDNLKQILEDSLEKENDIIDEDETNQGENIVEDIADSSDQDISDQDRVEQDISDQDRVEQDISGQDTVDQDITEQDNIEHDITYQDRVDQDNIEQVITDQDTTEQDISDKDRVEQDVSVQETEDQDEPARDTGLDDTITFTIVRGMSSRQVSELLKQKGLIEDAVDFDNYIKANGKSTIIRYGTFVLPRDASYNVILDVIVG